MTLGQWLFVLMYLVRLGGCVGSDEGGGIDVSVCWNWTVPQKELSLA